MMLDILWRASLGGATVVLFVWAICRFVPRLSPATRAVLWWCAAAKFVIALAWVAPVEVPVLPAAAGNAGSTFSSAASPAGPNFGSAVTATTPAPSATAGAPGGTEVPTYVRGVPGGTEVPPYVRIVLAGAWGIGLVFALGFSARRLRRVRELVNGASPGSSRLHQVAAELSDRLGLPRAPDVRMSDDIDTPLVTGIRRPVIVLPAIRFARLSHHEQRMAICHELAHVRRRDLALGCIPALAERLFFFHPLAHFAAREYALCREAACDEVVLNTLDAAPQEYGRLLLNLGVTRPRVGLAAAAGAPWSFPNLKRRLVMLGNPTAPSTMSRLLAGAAICVSAIALVPVQLVGRASSSSQDGAPAPAPVQAEQPVPAARAETTRRAADVRPPVAAARAADVRAAVAAANAAVADLQPVVAAAEVAVASVRATVADAQELAVAGSPALAELVTGDASSDRDTFMLLQNDDRMIWHASSKDHMRVRNLKRDGEPMLWYRRQGQEYVVRDPGVIAEANAIWKPVGNLGKAQGELGAKQGALGAGQGKHGSAMGALGAKQGEMGRRQGELAIRQAELALRQARRELSDEERQAIEKERDRIEAEMEKIGTEMEALGEKMQELAKPMDDLRKQMEPLAKQMEELGRMMEEASKRAEADMQKLMDRAIAEGKAEKVNKAEKVE